MFPGGTAASLVRAKRGADGWSFSEVLLKGGLSDPMHLVKAESPRSKPGVVKLKGMRDRGQDSFSPPYTCAAGRHTSVPYQVMAHGQTLLPYSSQGKQEGYLGQQQPDIEGLHGSVEGGECQ